jgi:hypothetical protein
MLPCATARNIGRATLLELADVCRNFFRVDAF